MQIKTTMEYQRYLLEWLKLEKLITLSIDIAMEQMQLLYFYWWGIWNGLTMLENSLVKRNAYICLYTVQYMNVRSRFPCSITFSKKQAKYPSSDKWINTVFPLF